MTRIGMLIFDDAEELDFVGPWEVFTMAAKQRPEIEVLTIAERAGTIRSSSSITRSISNRRAGNRSKAAAVRAAIASYPRSWPSAPRCASCSSGSTSIRTPDTRWSRSRRASG